MSDDFTNDHKILVAGSDFEHCQRKVLQFFETNFLVKYDVVDVLQESSHPAENDAFWHLVEEGMAENRKAIVELIGLLQEDGFGDLAKWHTMPQGYLSKTLHDITHLLDGFFGIDSAFYNLADDCHWVTPQFKEMINKDTSSYWLISVRGSSQSSTADRVPFLRPLGIE